MTKSIAIIGSGSASIGAIHQLFELKKQQKTEIDKVVIFEKSEIAGSGLPYDKSTTSPEHLFNIQTVNISIPYIALQEDIQKDRKGFLNWLQQDETKDLLDNEFKNIFFERFKRVFAKKFAISDDRITASEFFDSSQSFEESEIYKQYQENPEALAMINYHRDKFFGYKKQISEKSQDEFSFMPRIIYGFYSKALFEFWIEKLQEVGIEVEVKTQTEVEFLKEEDKKYKVGFKNIEKEIEISEFDYSYVGVGMFQYEDIKHKNPNYIRNIWPANKVEEAIENLALEASKKGEEYINIAILGSSLSAVDMVKSCFKDGNELYGVKIKVDLCSRNGRLQKTRSNFRWFDDEVQQFFPQALESVMKEKDLTYTSYSTLSEFYKNMGQNLNKIFDKIIQENIDSAASQSSSEKSPEKIHLYQVFGVFLDILQKAYQQNKQDDLAQQISDIKSEITKNKEDYKTSLAFLNSLEEQNPFEALKSDIERSRDISGQIFENVFNLFDNFASYRSKLPLDEQIFAKQYFRELLGRFWAPMPEDSSTYFLEKHEQGVLDVIKLGRSAKMTIPDQGQIELGDKKYDMMIDSSKAMKISKDTTSKLFQSLMSDVGALKPQKTEIAMSKEEFSETLKMKYGEVIADEISRNIISDQEEKAIYVSKNISFDNPSSVMINRAFFGINSSLKKAEKLIKDSVATEQMSK